jgi:TRAP-type C4-dicarboxylate transport system permease small subunit
MNTTATLAAAAPLRAAPARPGRLRRALDGLFLAAGALGALCVALICALMIWQSLGRWIGVSTGAITDIVAWLCAASGFFTMAHAFKHGDFVRVTLLLDWLSPAWRRRFELVALGSATLAVAYLAWWACRFTYDSWRFKELAQGLLALPIWIPQSSFALGSVLLWLAVLDEFLIVATGGVPTYVRLVAERHAAGDYSSDI